MEKSVILKEMFFNEFGLEEQDLRTYSPLTLAYIGDAIFELVVRTVLVERKNTQAEKLHKAATKIVKAETQALKSHLRYKQVSAGSRYECPAPPAQTHP